MPYVDKCTRTPVPAMPGWVTLTGPCFVTGFPHTTPPLQEEALKSYSAGANVGTAFPDLSIPEREFLISGTSPEGWRELFPEEEDQQGEERP